jgi:hypothetical protein
MGKFYFVICLLSASGAFSQNFSKSVDSYRIKANGMPIADAVNIVSAVETIASTTSESFTDLRALTEINTATGDAYPWISGDGLRLYYINGSGIENTIKFTQRPDTNSNFTIPADIPFTAGVPISIWLSQDELDAYVCVDPLAAGLYHMHRESVGESFGIPVLQTLSGITTTFLSSVSLTPDHNEMYVFTSVSGYQRLVRTSPTSFQASGTVNFAAGNYAGPGQLSKDGLDFFASSGPAGAITIKLLSRADTADAFDGTNAELITGINDVTAEVNSAPSVSDDNEWIAFVRSPDDYYETNDLYIARNANLSLTGTPAQNHKIEMYPNPSNGEIHFKWNTKTHATLEIFNNLGQLILQKPMPDYINLTRYESGIYFAKITASGFSETKKIILK